VLRIALTDGWVLGQSTMGEVARAWGRSVAQAWGGDDDYEHPGEKHYLGEGRTEYSYVTTLTHSTQIRLSYIGTAGYTDPRDFNEDLSRRLVTYYEVSWG
jgi:hypothetical protein